MSKIKEGVNETKNNFKMSWYFIKKQKKIIIPMLILSIILSLIGVLTPILSAKLLLNLSNKALDKLLNIALFIFLVEATRNIISFIFSLISEKCMTKIITEVRLEMLRETFFVQGLIVSVIAAVLVKLIVWRNYHKLLASSEEMDRPKRYWIGTLKKKIENYYSLNAKVNNISCIVDKYLEANKIMGINSFFLEQIPEICGILCIGLGCLGAVKGILMNSDINFWGGQLIVGVMFGIVVFLFDRLTNMEHTKRKIKINLLYYLENILPNRMEKNLKKQNYEKNEKIKKSQKIKQEKEDARQLKEHWGEIASAKELQLTDEDIQTLKDFMKDL